MMTRKKKTTEKRNEGLIHRDTTHNEKETNRDNLNKVTEEWSDDTTPADMEECVSDKDNDKKKLHRI